MDDTRAVPSAVRFRLRREDGIEVAFLAAPVIIDNP